MDEAERELAVVVLDLPSGRQVGGGILPAAAGNSMREGDALGVVPVVLPIRQWIGILDAGVVWVGQQIPPQELVAGGVVAARRP